MPERKDLADLAEYLEVESPEENLVAVFLASQVLLQLCRTLFQRAVADTLVLVDL